MADETISLEILIQKAEGAKSIAELRQSLKDLQSEAIKAGEAGDSALAEKFFNAAAKVKNELRDVREKIDALNPEKKFEAFAKAGASIAGGFEAATAAAALFGNKNEELEKSLLKVQAAMALADGIQKLSEIGKAFNILKSIILSNPLFALAALIIGIGTAIYELKDKFAIFGKIVEGVGDVIDGIKTAFTSLTDALGLTSEEERKLAENMDETNKRMKEREELLNEQESIQRNYIDLLKSQGATQEQIYQEELKIYKNRITFANNQLDDFKSKMKKQSEITKEEYEKQTDDLNKLMNNQMFAREGLDAFINNHYNEVDKKNEERFKKEQDDQKQQYEKLKQQDEKYHQQALDAYGKWLEAMHQQEIKQEQDARDKHKKLVEDQQEQLKQVILGAKDYVNEEQKKIDDDYEKNKEDLLKKSFEAEAALSEAITQLRLNHAIKGSAEEYKIRKQQFEINKVVSATETAIAGIKATQKALAEVPAPFGIPLAILNAGIAAGNVVKILSQKFEGGGGFTNALGGANAPTLSAASNGVNIKPVATSSNSTLLNPDGSVKQENTPVVKAYVVESEMTAAQNKISSIQRKSTF